MTASILQEVQIIKKWYIFVQPQSIKFVSDLMGPKFHVRQVILKPENAECDREYSPKTITQTCDPTRNIILSPF